VVGAYRVLHQIGAGGMGAVFLAEHVALGRRAALKVLHPEYSMRGDIVARFFNEARAATAINDPGIVQIFDFGVHSDGRAYIVMELLDGEALDRRLEQRGTLGLTGALRIMRQVATTIGAAHARGIVHRDLKPENIFMVRDAEVPGGERPKILDFGIAKLAGQGAGVKTRTSTMMGTPTFMSPEQCRGAGLVDARSDIYALGCVLYMLLTGRPPFDADGPGEIIAMHLREPPRPPSRYRAGIPAAVDQLVLRCLEKDPAARFPSASDLVMAIAMLIGSTPEPAAALARPPAAPAPLRAPTTLSDAAAEHRTVISHRSRAITGGLVAGVIAGLALAIVVARGKHKIAVALADARVAEPANGLDASAPIAATPEPVPADAAPSLAELVTPSVKSTLARFEEWSHAHPGAPCPAVGDVETTVDPWDRPLRITCTEQPSDQIVGVTSDGPDGARHTADDIVSWRLGPEVTDLVRGPRWHAVVRAR
jgi:serine/threonine-protein kinase